MVTKRKRIKRVGGFVIVFLLLVIVGVIAFYKIKYISPDKEEKTKLEQKIDSLTGKKNPDNLPPKKKPEIKNAEDDSEQILPEEEIESEEPEEMNIEPEQEDITIISPEKKELLPVYIPRSGSLIRNSEEPTYNFLGNSSLTFEQRQLMKLDEINIGPDFKTIPLENLFPGKTYYEGDNGVLKSFIYVDRDKKVQEFLISFDVQGNYVDCIEIGLMVSGSDEKKYAVIANNKLSIFESHVSKTLKKASDNGDEEEVIVTEYYINPHLQFQKGKTFSRLR